MAATTMKKGTSRNDNNEKGHQSKKRLVGCRQKRFIFCRPYDDCKPFDKVNPVFQLDIFGGGLSSARRSCLAAESQQPPWRAIGGSWRDHYRAPNK
jgi:hypothetical protein